MVYEPHRDILHPPTVAGAVMELNNSHHIPIHIQKCNEMLSKATLAAIVNKVNHKGQEIKGSGVEKNTHLIQ